MAAKIVDFAGAPDILILTMIFKFRLIQPAVYRLPPSARDARSLHAARELRIRRTARVDLRSELRLLPASTVDGAGLGLAGLGMALFVISGLLTNAGLLTVRAYGWCVTLALAIYAAAFAGCRRGRS